MTSHHLDHEAKDRDGKDDDGRRASSLRHRFSSMWTLKPEEASREDTRGPLGLRLLFASPEPMIEIIFVHGLQGGSVKTWQKGHDPALFWPQRWLPIEAEFRNASTYSFGYEADWKSSHPSILNIHDFGQALYEEIRSSPLLWRNPENPIIMVGHSMGGLVIKKAHIMAHRDRGHSGISNRMQAIFFLATPHRGSDYAALLNNILKLYGPAGFSSSREYIDDLKVGSASTQLINEEFARCAANLSIFSFYETLRTSIGVSSTIIVGKDSAVLGPEFPNERSVYLNAKHGDMCKFNDRSDANYLTVKNALGSVVRDLSKLALVKKERFASFELKYVRHFLGTDNHGPGHYDKVDGSCHWIDQRDDFRNWRDAAVEIDKSNRYKPSLYWIIAAPGAGKTFLMAYIESQMGKSGLQHAAYHFNFGEKSANSLPGLLRSIAYQMAQSNATVRRTLMKLQDEASTLDLDDARVIWSKIFRAGILQIPMSTPQYWLIDGVDECVAYGELFSLFKGLLVPFPLKVLITSRKLADMTKLVRQLQAGDVALQVVQIPVQDTMRDIELHIASRIADLPVESGEATVELTKQIIAKSNASFLWVRFVLDELEGVYGQDSIVKVLQGIPEGMISYYRRTVTEMAGNRREKHVAKAILRWVSLAARPLSALELAHALSFDVKTQLSSPKSAIEGLCGHLVSIDAAGEQVRIVHSTATEFLLSEDAGDFRISAAETHERIALVCLKRLCGPEMQPPKHKRMLEIKRPQMKAPPLLDYAISHFSDHLLGVSGNSDELLSALVSFLSSNTSTWIEKVATRRDMHSLVRTARDLRVYLVQRSRYSSSRNQQTMCVESWSTDLERLAMKFHSALLSHPQSIHFLIPPLCPADSAIHRQARRAPDSLTLLGSKNQHWEDCVAILDFSNHAAATVSCGENLFAVGFESGDIGFYNNRGQETGLVIQSDFEMSLMQFDPENSFIAGASRRFLMLWDLHGNLLWKTKVKVQFYILAFSSTHVLGITQQGKALKYDIETGSVVDSHGLSYQAPDDVDTGYAVPTKLKAPCAASISPNLELIAFAYRNGPVCLFDLESTSFISWALEANKRCPQYLFFTPNPDMDLLLVIYDESHMSLFDPWSGVVIKEHIPEKHIIPISAACSPSGRTFATVNIQGTLRIWDFESLVALYHITTPNHWFRTLKFTTDDLSLLDMTEHDMKIWSPSTLTRGPFEERDNVSVEPEAVAVPVAQFETLQQSRIRTFTAHPTLSVIFVGRNNGDIVLYSLTDGKEAGVLYTHQDTVNYIAACRESVVASCDLFHIIQVCSLDVARPDHVRAKELKFKARAAAPIRQLLLDDMGEYLLVSTTQADYVYRTSDGTIVGSLDWDKNTSTSWKWFTMSYQGDDAMFALIQKGTLTYYSASSFPTTCAVPALRLDYAINEGIREVTIDTALLNSSASQLVIQHTQRSTDTAHSSTAIFQLPPPPSLSPLSIPCLPTTHSRAVKYALGFTADKRFVFLRQDSWVCSIPIDGGSTSYIRHFFVPNDYTTTSYDVMPVKTAGDCFVFCLFDKIAVIKNGLKFQDHVDVEMT